MSEQDGGASTASGGETALSQEQRAEILARLERATTIYGICLRDYFSTFGTYTTATSILVAAIGFLVRETPSVAGKAPSANTSLLTLLVAICGLILCVQWYISTASMRDQVRHFRNRIIDLEDEAGLRLMNRWLEAAKLRFLPEREWGDYKNGEAREDARQLNPTFWLLGTPLGLRGAMLPVIYSAVFVGVGTSFFSPDLRVISFIVAIVWLVGWSFLIYLFRRRRGHS